MGDFLAKYRRLKGCRDCGVSDPDRLRFYSTSNLSRITMDTFDPRFWTTHDAEGHLDRLVVVLCNGCATAAQAKPSLKSRLRAKRAEAGNV